MNGKNKSRKMKWNKSQKSLGKEREVIEIVDTPVTSGGKKKVRYDFTKKFTDDEDYVAALLESKNPKKDPNTTQVTTLTMTVKQSIEIAKARRHLQSVERGDAEPQNKRFEIIMDGFKEKREGWRIYCDVSEPIGPRPPKKLFTQSSVPTISTWARHSDVYPMPLKRRITEIYDEEDLEDPDPENVLWKAKKLRLMSALEEYEDEQRRIEEEEEEAFQNGEWVHELSLLELMYAAWEGEFTSILWEHMRETAERIF